MNRTFLIGLFSACWLLSGFASQTNVVTVLGVANIYGAGHSSPPGPAGGGAGVLPPVVNFPVAMSNIFTFSITGNATPDGSTYYDYDGGPYPTDLSPYNGISGIKAPTAFFLTGVFLRNLQPSNPPPGTLDFNAIGLDFSNVAPAIGQLFFIGNGYDSSGAVQQFIAPSGANRLFLGFADGFGYSGLPGAYGDNAGSLTVTVTNISADPGTLSVEIYADLTLTGNIGKTYLVEFTSQLNDTNTVWTPLTNIVLPASPFSFFDMTTPARGSRFYRATTVP